MANGTEGVSQSRPTDQEKAESNGELRTDTPEREVEFLQGPPLLATFLHEAGPRSPSEVATPEADIEEFAEHSESHPSLQSI